MCCLVRLFKNPFSPLYQALTVSASSSSSTGSLGHSWLVSGCYRLLLVSSVLKLIVTGCGCYADNMCSLPGQMHLTAVRDRLTFCELGLGVWSFEKKYGGNHHADHSGTSSEMPASLNLNFCR